LIGISSFLLINFWYTRIQANKSGIKALTVNRVGDMFLSVGFFAIFWVFGNVDYATVFSVAPLINETAITIIGLLLLVGAMAKSAQLGLHTWLPDAMEGWKKYILICTIIFIISIMDSESFNREIMQVGLPPILMTLPKKTLHTMTGNMLGDGSIRYNNMNRNNYVPKGNCRYAMTIKSSSVNYMQNLYNTIYASFSNVGLRPYPNPTILGNQNAVVNQYRFSTRSLPIFTALHSLWYRFDFETKTFIKVVPSNIGEMFSPVSLAHWIIEDGYFDSYGRTQTVLLCTESFTQRECQLLQTILLNWKIVTTLKVRNKAKNTYRIRVSKRSIPLLRELVIPYMHSEFMYKLG
jgi:hypothetical protein